MQKEYIEQDNQFALNRMGNFDLSPPEPESASSEHVFKPSLDPYLGYDAIMAGGIHGPTQQTSVLDTLRANMAYNQAQAVQPAAPVAQPASPQASVPTQTKQTKVEPKTTTKEPKETKPKKEHWALGEEVKVANKTVHELATAQFGPEINEVFDLKGLVTTEDGKVVVSVNVKDPSKLAQLKLLENEDGGLAFDPENTVFGVEIDLIKEPQLHKDNPELDIVRLPTSKEVQQEAKNRAVIERDQKKDEALNNVSTTTGNTPEQVAIAADQGTLMYDQSGGKTTMGPIGSEINSIKKQITKLEPRIPAQETAIIEWSKIDDRRLGDEKIRQITVGLHRDEKQLTSLEADRAQLYQDLATLEQSSTKEQLDDIRVKEKEAKGTVKATWHDAGQAWKDSVGLPIETRNQQQISYTNSANQQAWVMQDKSAMKQYYAEEKALKKTLGIAEDLNVWNFDGKVDSDEKAIAKARLEELYWEGKSISKDLLQGALEYREGKLAAKTLEGAEALWTDIVGDEASGIEGNPKLKSFIESEKAQLLVPVWELNNRPTAKKASLVASAISDYKIGVISINEINQLKTDLLNVKAFQTYYKDWSDDENTNIDILIDQLNKALINE